MMNRLASLAAALVGNPNAAAAALGLPPVHPVNPVLLSLAVARHAVEIGEAFDGSDLTLDAGAIAAFAEQLLISRPHLMDAFIFASGRQDFDAVAALDADKTMALFALVLTASTDLIRSDSFDLGREVLASLAPHSARLRLLLAPSAGPLN